MNKTATHASRAGDVGAGESAPDRDLISRFIETGYINAFHDAEYPKLRRLFHKDSWYFFTARDGTLYKERSTMTRSAAGQGRNTRSSR